MKVRNSLRAPEGSRFADRAPPRPHLRDQQEEPAHEGPAGLNPAVS